MYAGVVAAALLLGAGAAAGAPALQAGARAEGPPRAVPAATPRAAGTSRAAVIIDTGQRVFRTVVTFDGSISGAEALQRAGADPVFALYAGKGAGVCSLLGVGHGPDDCFGVAAGDGRYWGYFRAPAGSTSFRYWGTGASSSMVGDGDVEGWAYGVRPAPPAYVSVAGVAGDPAPGAAPPAAGSGGGSVGGAPPPGATGAVTGGEAPGSAAGGSPPGGSPPGGGDRPDGAARGAGAPAGGPSAATTPSTAGARAASGSGAVEEEKVGRPGQTAARRRARGGAEGGAQSGVPASLAVFGLAAAGLAGGIVAARRARSRRS